MQHPSMFVVCLREPDHSGKHWSSMFVSAFPNGCEAIYVEWSDDWGDDVDG